MEADPNIGGERAGDVVAAMTHRHRNQIQNMSSLVGMFGRRMPAGECRDAFTHLRARFEAIGYVWRHDAPVDDQPVETDLGEFTRRLLDILETEASHHVAIAAVPVIAPARRAAGVCQIACEITIALVRCGLPAGAAGAAEITAGPGPDGVIVISASAHGATEDRPRSGDLDLGWSIAGAMAQSLGGTLERLSDQPLALEARIPAMESGR